jgi:hypothetical protein
VALYPVLTAALWIAGGVMFKLLDAGRRMARRHDPHPGL